MEDDEHLAQIDALSNWAVIEDGIPEQLLSQGSSHEDDADAEKKKDDDKKEEEDDEPKANRLWEKTYRPGLFGKVTMWIFFIAFCIVFGLYYYVAT